MRRTWLSLRSLKQHEFRKTLRYIKTAGASWHDIYIQLGKLQETAVSKLIKSCTAIFIYYLLLSSLGDEEQVSITVQGVTASLPTAFVAVMASVGLFLIVMQAQSVLMLTLLRAHEGTRLSLRGFSMGAYGLYNGQDEMELPTPLLRRGSFQEVLPVSVILTFLYVIVLAFLLVPLGALWTYLMGLQWGILNSQHIAGSYRFTAGFGVFTLISAVFYLGLFNCPLPLKKNKFAIRWGFLVRNYAFGQHPRRAEWLKESN